MGMFDSMYDKDNREWQTKAFGRQLEAWDIGDRIPAEQPDCQVKVLGGRADDASISRHSLATIRDGRLTAVPDERDDSLPLLDYQGGWLVAPKGL